MLSKRSPNYLKAIIICHGKSEIIFAKNLRSNLKLNIAIDSNNNGKSSVQVTSILHFLRKNGYTNSKSIIKKYDGMINHKKDKILNLKIFIIMDIDEPELTDKLISQYINKDMFDELDYKDLIVPIYNNKNFDDVLNGLGYKIDINNKVKSYTRVFPGTNGDIKAFETLRDNFKNTHNSNLNILLDYLNDLIVKF